VAIEFSVAENLQGRVRSGLLALEDVTVRENDPMLDAEVDRLCATLRERYGKGKSSEVPGAADARTLYKALGIDPTKTRPSNEALLRRALKGETLYRINTLVDALNLVSLREQLPFGLYDLDRVRPPVTLRKGAPGEATRASEARSTSRRDRCWSTEGPFGNRPRTRCARRSRPRPGARWSSHMHRPDTASAG
jgi:DNA/RNA-binding domain of Phe-tRNA-synthetase-like protein